MRRRTTSHNPADSRARRHPNAASLDRPGGACPPRPKGRGRHGPDGRVAFELDSPDNRQMSFSEDVACGAMSQFDSPPDTDVARLQVQLSTLRDDKQRAECMASIQRDAVQLALDLLVTHPDLRGFFRMFIKRLVDDSGAHACGVWLLDESTNACDLWMANIGGETLMADSPGWASLDLPRESMTR